MNKIVNDLTKKLNSILENFIENKNFSIENVENNIIPDILNATLSYIGEVYSAIDEEIYSRKKERKEEGLVLHKKKVERVVLTKFGILRFNRNYYKSKEKEYCYLLDEVIGLESYERLTNTLKTNLVETAIAEPYSKVIKYVVNGTVSKQTVMNCIRNSYPLNEGIDKKKEVKYIHVDADEKYVPMQRGKSQMVKLVSVYEGIESQKGRGTCKNIFHIAKKTSNNEEYWKEVYNAINERYDTKNTKFYLHCDGGQWIEEGLEWLPDCTKTIDKFHIEQAILRSLRGFKLEEISLYKKRIRKSIKEDNREEIKQIYKEMKLMHPEREKTIRTNISYIYNNFEGMAVYNKDKEANNGDCTEQHISHVLARRLTGVPCGWSKKTLDKLVQIISSKRVTFKAPLKEEAIEEKATRKQQRRKIKNKPGYINPDRSIGISAASNSNLYKALKTYFGD